MGIRFACHVCQRRLNIKRQLAGRRGICPVCAARIRIPLDDAEQSSPVDTKSTGVTAKPRRRTATASAEGDSGAAVEQLSASIDAAIMDDDRPDAATWYVRPPTGGQYGPATNEVLKQWIEEGRVAATALLWREGWQQWRDASDALPEFADRLPAAGQDSSGGFDPMETAATEAQPELPIAATDPIDRAERIATAEEPRRTKSMRKWMTLGVLSLLALTLLGVLALVVSR